MIRFFVNALMYPGDHSVSYCLLIYRITWGRNVCKHFWFIRIIYKKGIPKRTITGLLLIFRIIPSHAWCFQGDISKRELLFTSPYVPSRNQHDNHWLSFSCRLFKIHVWSRGVCYMRQVFYIFSCIQKHDLVSNFVCLTLSIRVVPLWSWAWP